MTYSNSFNNILDLIGSTKVIRLCRVIPANYATVWAKLELFNPGGSIKDRICLNMLTAAEKQGLINPKTHTIVEATSGNTGIGLALTCKVKGYKLILTMPDDMSYERKQVLRAYGTQLILTPAKDKLKGAMKKAEQIASELPNSYMPKQFENPYNPQTHSNTTATELLSQIPGKIDAFVASISTGGSITGIGHVLRKKFPNIKIFAVEPYECAVLSGEKPQNHDIQGIGPGFIPKVLDSDIYDDILKIKSEDAKDFTKEIAKKEGLLIGVSSGAVGLASKTIAKKLGKSKQVATIFSDSGERYLSTDLFNKN
ncbi:MAG: cysteine synthase A [Deltaproteobacteria bacterium]|nr:cysteine synthase A [Candidatus Dadabacteria bacterium]TDJ05038.1 MAG: cysteine synthase A [Deltaproteobacteria bacterium]